MSVAAVAVALACAVPAGWSSAAEGPLSGRTIVIDPGHQLGNSNPKFARQMSQTFFNGTTRKGCNTTGTATNAGYPEATMAWAVAQALVPLLEKAGAKVILTRSSNSYDDWGPCVWTRAQIANRAGADAMVSIHGNGAPASQHGFFAMAPTRIPGWTDDIWRADRRFSRAMIAGMLAAGAPGSNVPADHLYIDSNTTSLNVSNVPTTTIELGNMRNPSDARRMSSASGQRQYAEWLYAGLLRYFSR